MRRLLIVALLIVVSATPALADGGHIGLYTDGAFTDCAFLDFMGQVVFVYVVHQLAPGVSGSQFRITIDGYTGVLVSVTFPILYIEDPDIFAGDTVPYASCEATPYALATFSLLNMGTSPQCASFQVVADPHTGGGSVLAFDCEGGTLTATGGRLVVNPTEDCDCTVGAENATWGKIKSLYANEGR
jgi:hypothetical protein